MFWHYNKYFNHPIPLEFQLPGHNDATPVYPLDGDVSNVFVKDESVNITGTHKDRSFRYWVSKLLEEGVKKAVISSSGSAARSAAHFCKIAEIDLAVFTWETTKTPKKDAMAYAREHDIPNLRSSTAEYAIEGYKTLAFELVEQHRDVQEIFLPVSSGAALLGMYGGYKLLAKEGGVSMPRLYIVQTTKVHPMAEIFDNNFTEEETHESRAIVDKIAHRKDSVVEAVKESGGGGYIISNKELENAKSHYLNHFTRKPGNESFLTLAALKKHRERNPEYRNAKSVCIFTN